jgi:hypothetical protein
MFVIRNDYLSTVLITAALLAESSYGHRTEAAYTDVAHALMYKGFPVAKEFEHSWSQRRELRKFLQDIIERMFEDTEDQAKLDEQEMIQKLREIFSNEEKDPLLTDEVLSELLQLLWLLPSQQLVAAPSFRCANLCAVCVPTESAFAEDEPMLKSIFIGRSRGWRGEVNMPVVAPVDAVAGGLGGVVRGANIGTSRALKAGGVAGILAGNAVADKVNGPPNSFVSQIPGNLLGTIAGIGIGSASSILVFSALQLILPMWGLLQGSGITGTVTGCDRVGFKAFVNDEYENDESYRGRLPILSEHGMARLRRAMKYNKSTAQAARALQDEGLLPEERYHDYDAILHCEYLRRRNFDVRHMPECMKHSMLCGGDGAMVLPIQELAECKALSNTTYLREQAFQAGQHNVAEITWKKAKERGACYKLLCKYDGYTNGILVTHPDTLQDKHIEDPAILSRCSEDLAAMHTCKANLKARYGAELTLDSAEERSTHCSGEHQLRCFDAK